VDQLFVARRGEIREILPLVSGTAVDTAMLLRDIMMPLPMRDDWGPEMEWPYPGVPRYRRGLCRAPGCRAAESVNLNEAPSRGCY
jgi:hypothetical protein